MTFQFKFLFLIKYRLAGKLQFGHHIVHKGKQYSHIAFGLFIRSVIGSPLKKVYLVTFENNAGHKISIELIHKHTANRYKKEKNFKVESKFVWKKR